MRDKGLKTIHNIFLNLIDFSDSMVV